MRLSISSLPRRNSDNTAELSPAARIGLGIDHFSTLALLGKEPHCSWASSKETTRSISLEGT